VFFKSITLKNNKLFTCKFIKEKGEGKLVREANKKKSQKKE
jgi:hypothetical protein